MKLHEKRAVKRAAIHLIAKYLRESNTTNDYFAIPYHAVRLVELRAGRLYDYRTSTEAHEYARNFFHNYKLHNQTG